MLAGFPSYFLAQTSSPHIARFGFSIADSESIVPYTPYRNDVILHLELEKQPNSS